MPIKSNKSICFGIILFTIMTMGISSADPLDIELFSHFGGIVNDVVVSGNYAYTGLILSSMTLPISLIIGNWQSQQFCRY